MTPKSIRRGLLVGLMAGAMTASIVPAAGAEPDTTVVESDPSVAMTVTSEGPAIVTSSRVRCRVNISDPELTDSEERVRVRGRVVCNGKVRALHVRVWLYENGKVVEDDEKSDSDRRSLSLSVSHKCDDDARYRGRVRARIRYEKGSRQTITLTSDTVTLKRCDD